MKAGALYVLQPVYNHFVCFSFTEVSLILHSASAGTIITNLFCQPTMQHHDCLWDVKVVVMNI